MNSLDICKTDIMSLLAKFVQNNPDFKLRYEFSASLDLHLIEVSPPEQSDSGIMDEFDEYLTSAIAAIDDGQSVMIFPVGDLDFEIKNCEFEKTGILYQSCELEQVGFYFQDQYKRNWEPRRPVQQGSNSQINAEQNDQNFAYQYDDNYAMAA